MAERIKLTEEEAQDIVMGHEDYVEIDEIKGEPRRWNQAITTIVERISDGKLFALTWDAGLTEIQEHSFYDCELVEVERHVETETIEVVTYPEVQA